MPEMSYVKFYEDAWLKGFEKSMSAYVKMHETMIEKMIETSKTFNDTLTGLLFGKNKSIFRARVQKGGRISIPSVELEYLNVNEGDIVKVIIIKE